MWLLQNYWKVPFCPLPSDFETHLEVLDPPLLLLLLLARQLEPRIRYSLYVLGAVTKLSQ